MFCEAEREDESEEWWKNDPESLNSTKGQKEHIVSFLSPSLEGVLPLGSQLSCSADRVCTEDPAFGGRQGFEELERERPKEELERLQEDW